VLKGYTVDYDGEEAEVSVAGQVLQRFKTMTGPDGITALVLAQRWIKKQSAAPVETDKGVFDSEARDEHGNLLPIKSLPSADDDDTEDEAQQCRNAPHQATKPAG